MLWRKAWRESRVRFLIGAAALALFCGVLLQRDVSRLHLYSEFRPPYSAVVGSAVYAPVIEVVFVLSCLILGLGGLQRERVTGTSAFTLALPVPRWTLVGVRAGVGMLQVSALALIPALVVAVLTPVLTAETYPMGQSLRFAMLFLSWGLVWFAASVFWSTALSGEYLPVLAALLTPFAFTAAYVNLPDHMRATFPAGDFFEYMSGASLLEPETFFFVEPLPMATIAALIAAAFVIVWGAAAAASRQHF